VETSHRHSLLKMTVSLYRPHMQNGLGKILPNYSHCICRKHYRTGRRRRTQQIVEISQYLYCQQSNMTTLLPQSKRHLTVSEEVPCLQQMRKLSSGEVIINHDQQKNDIRFSTMYFSCLGAFTASVESRFSSHLSHCCSCRIPKGFKDQNLTRSHERGNKHLIYCLSPA